LLNVLGSGLFQKTLLLVPGCSRRRCTRCTEATNPCTWRWSWSSSAPWSLPKCCWFSGDRGTVAPTMWVPSGVRSLLQLVSLTVLSLPCFPLWPR
jgi:hypothetical protein